MTRLRSNVIWALGADGLQVVLGLGAFLVLGRVLGTTEFGVYSAVLAMSTLAMPVFSFGAQQLLMLDMQADKLFARVWPRSVATVVFGGVVATVLATIVIRPFVVAGLSVVEFSLLFGSQVIMFALSEFALVSAQAHRRLQVAAGIRTFSGLVRLAAVLVFAYVGGSTAGEWAWFAVATWAVAACGGLLIVRFAFGASPLGALPTTGDLRRGVPYAVGAGSSLALDAVDRPMLVSISGESAAGVYAAGYRLVQSALLPITALVRATDADFFAAGDAGPEAARQLARRLSRIALAYGVPAGALLALGAPLVSIVLGDEWNESVSVIRWLAFMPAVKAMQIFVANALTGLGMQSKRNRALQIALVANVAMNLVLMPNYGWRGAAASTLAAEAFMTALMWRAFRRATSNSSD